MINILKSGTEKDSYPCSISEGKLFHADAALYEKDFFMKSTSIIEGANTHIVFYCIKYSALQGFRTMIKLIISHVKIYFQTIITHWHCLWIFHIARKDCSLYNKQNNAWVRGNTRFILSVERDFFWLIVVK